MAKKNRDFFVFCSKNFFLSLKCRLATGIRLSIFYAYIHFSNRRGNLWSGMPICGRKALKHKVIDGKSREVYKSLFIRELKSAKIQGTYFKICALYFKIYGLYFSRNALCFLRKAEKRKKELIYGIKIQALLENRPISVAECL